MKKSKHRLTFLIVESEPQQGLSTRKLLIETAKHNVLTAYSPQEGLETLRRFPNVDCVVFDMSSENMTCDEFVEKIKTQNSNCKVIALAPTDGETIEGAKCAYAVVPSQDPAALLMLLEEEFGVPDAA